MQENSVRDGTLPLSVDEDDIDLIYPLIVLAKYKKTIIFAPIVAAIAVYGASFLISNTYTATAQVMPAQAQSAASSMLSQLGSLGGLAGGALGVKSPNDIYIGMLESRTVQERIVKKFKLQDVYDEKYASDTRKALSKVTKITNGKNGLITIAVEDKSPARAADIANAYIGELEVMTQTFAVTEASQRRLFFEKQLILAKNGLVTAEVSLKELQEKTGLIQLSGQADAIIKSAAGFRAQIAAKEVAIGAMRAFATTNNPEYIQLQQELIGLKAQLAKTEVGMNKGKGDLAIPTSNVPEIGLDYIRRVRDVKYYEMIYELLSKQFEMAKIDEAKDNSAIQILDNAVSPDKKSGPGRAIMALSAGVIMFFLAIIRGFVRESFASSAANPEKREKIDMLHSYLRWKS